MGKRNAIYMYADKQNQTFRAAVQSAVQEAGSVAGAARVIGIYPSSLWRFIKKHNIQFEFKRTVGGVSEKERGHEPSPN